VADELSSLGGPGHVKQDFVLTFVVEIFRTGGPALTSACRDLRDEAAVLGRNRKTNRKDPTGAIATIRKLVSDESDSWMLMFQDR
jgi:hypothetical protein